MKDIFLVDVDDTILDFQGVSLDALRFAFLQNGVQWNDGLYREFRAFNASLWEALERKELTRQMLMKERFCWFFKRMNMFEVDGYTINNSFIEYISNNPRYMDGAEEFLYALSKMGKIYFVTNGTEEIQKRRFAILKLWEKAEDVFISQCIGFDKPAKEYTEYVKTHIEGFLESRAVWIGDSLSADVRAANEANVTSIWFNTNKKVLSGMIKPDYEANNFEEILKILQKINDKL